MAYGTLFSYNKKIPSESGIISCFRVMLHVVTTDHIVDHNLFILFISYFEKTLQSAKSAMIIPSVPHLIFICPRSVSYKSMVYLLSFLLSSSLYLTMQLSYFPVIASIFSLPLGVYMTYKRNFLEVIILMNIH